MALDVTLNDGQARALDEIQVSIKKTRRHLLTGHAGSGKTTLLQVLSSRTKRRLVLTAPTHKAVAVLSRKLRAAGIDTECQTIHSLLSLRPKPRGDRMIFERHPRAKPVNADIVVIDECSMLDSQMMRLIEEHLPGRAVIFCGDPAQLPPVNEKASRSFGVTPHSHLDRVVRQAEGNPILAAASMIRENQSNGIAWDWSRSAKVPPLGIYRPADPEGWMRKGFLSNEFKADADAFRYLCWTNQRVAEVNGRVRRWIYGDNIPTPFMPGERALMRAPVFVAEETVVNTNEEVTVLEIEESDYLFVPTWAMKIRTDAGAEWDVHLIKDEKKYNREVRMLAEQAALTHDWEAYHVFKQSFVTAQHIFAMTVHTSQGSTFRNTFVDIADIRRRERENKLEMQQLLYVAATRPTHALILIGAPHAG